MSQTSTSPGFGPVELSSVFTQAEGQLLAFLFAHGEQPLDTLVTSTALGLGDAACVALRRLEGAGLVVTYDDVVDLSLDTHGAMMLAVETSKTVRPAAASESRSNQKAAKRIVVTETALLKALDSLNAAIAALPEDSVFASSLGFLVGSMRWTVESLTSIRAALKEVHHG